MSMSARHPLHDSDKAYTGCLHRRLAASWTLGLWLLDCLFIARDRTRVGDTGMHPGRKVLLAFWRHEDERGSGEDWTASDND